MDISHLSQIRNFQLVRPATDTVRRADDMHEIPTARRSLSDPSPQVPIRPARVWRSSSGDARPQRPRHRRASRHAHSRRMQTPVRRNAPVAREAPRESKVTLVALSSKLHSKALWRIVSDADTMKWVASGQPWTRSKLTRFFRYCAAEAKIKPSARTTNYWGIALDGKFVGIVGFHPIVYDRSMKSKLFATYFIDSRARGSRCGSRAMALAIAKIRAVHPGVALYADTRTNNCASSTSLTRCGFVRIAQLKIRGISSARWVNMA